MDIRSNVLAGVVQTIGNNLGEAKAVVLATGTKNIDAMALSEDALPDTHAEVVARRCLMVYFYDQIELYLDPGKILKTVHKEPYKRNGEVLLYHKFFFNAAKSHQSIFEKSPYDGRLRVKENIQFHLYISKGPCGDATAFGIEGPSLYRPDRYIVTFKFIFF